MEVMCSRCGSTVMDRGNVYACKCFSIHKIVSKKELPPDAVRDLFVLGRTGVIRGFVSTKGKQFDASLSIEGDKLVFKFDNGGQPRKRMTAIATSRGSSGLARLCVSGNCSLERWIHFGLVSPHLVEAYALIVGAKYVLFSLGDDASNEEMLLRASNNLLVKYLLRHQCPRSTEVRRVIAYLNEVLSGFKKWTAEWVPSRGPSLSGMSHGSNFPQGIFPWLHIGVVRKGDRALIQFPPDPAVHAQFQSSILRANPVERDAFDVPLAAEKVVWKWLEVVRGQGKQ